MNLRKNALSPSWYPQDAEGVRRFLLSLPLLPETPGAVAALAPHAGWYYSGAVAARAAAALDRDAETLVVCGGHLPAGAPALFAEEDAAATPLGDLEIDGEFRSLLWDKLNGKPDRYRDNTVEVLLPMVKHFFPQTKLVWLRLGADLRSYEAGKLIAQTALSLKRKTVLLGSTDLTHYGGGYGFSPHGGGPAALEWVKTVNDRGFINAVLAGAPEETLVQAERNRAACSAGAALACLGYTAELAAGSGKLLAYATSADVGESGEIPDSFVGYAAIAWPRRDR